MAEVLVCIICRLSSHKMASRTQRDASLMQQTFALLMKHVLVQGRRLGHTILEWIQHLALVFMLYLALFFTHSRHGTPEPANVLGRLDNFSTLPIAVGYVRTSPDIQDMMQRVANSSITPGISVKEFDTEEELLEAISSGTDIGITFQNEYAYYIRYRLGRISTPNDHLVQRGDYSDSPLNYWTKGFISLQAGIDSAIIERTTGKLMWNDMAATQAVIMSTVSDMQHTILDIALYTLDGSACFISLSYLLTLQVTKERRKTRELMRMMGLKDSAFWLSWGLLYLVSVLIIAILLSVITTAYLLVESSFGLILLLFFLYGVATVCFNFMLSALFRKPRFTALAGFFITIFLSLLGFLPAMRALPRSLEVFLSLFHPFSFAVGFTESMHMENELQGVFFSDLGGDSSHVLFSCLYLVLDSVLYFSLTLYFDKIIPDKNGLRHEPLFFLKPSFWVKKQNRTPVPSDDKGKVEQNSEEYMEKVPNDLLGKEAIRILNIKKIYGSKDEQTEALRGLHLDIYEGQITALLGHSGAGKTTLLNILSGMNRASSGLATIYNHQLSDLSDLQEIRKKIGVCPQFDVNFDLLTVKENLQFFAMIKGIPYKKIKTEVEKVLSELDIEDLQHLRANKLSGGQRRKLTLAIAVLGDPEVLLLDEPTAGLDPFSRHHVWSMLKKRKAGRVTLFSTQFMDEADILADRKAVLSNGRLKCVGSSFFLKRKWGIGYHLRIQMTPSSNIEAMASLIKQHISSAKLATQNVEDVTFTLPFQNMDSFPALFSDLDNHIGKNIVSYGVSMTTLDDVFLKLEGEAEIEKGDYGVFTREQSAEEEHFSVEPDESILLMSDSGTPTINGMALWRQQVLAVARMRYLKLIHDTKNFRSIILLLVLFITPLLIFCIVLSVFHTLHIWELTPHLYFQGPGDRSHKYFTHLLLNNNTGLPIEHLVAGIKAQDITVDVVDGPYDMDTVSYNGAIEVNRDHNESWYRIVGNPRAQNAFPVLINIITNAQMSLSTKERVRVWNHPYTPALRSDGFLQLIQFLFGLTFMVFSAGFAPHFAMSSMEDIKIKARSQLRISGLFPSAYWLGQAITDIIFYWLLLFLMIAILFAFNYEIPLYFEQAASLIGEILFYGISMVLYVYMITFVFGKRKIHPDRWSFFFILSSSLVTLVYFISLNDLGSYTFFFIYIFFVPPAALLGYFTHLISPYITLGYIVGQTDQHLIVKPTIIVDSLRKELKEKSGTFNCCRKKKKRTAVRHVSFCVKKGEVLGLLGPNGAGKTTSVLMLAGELKPTTGKVALCSVEAPNKNEDTAFLGYCSQNNPLWPNLTVKEHLEIYAAIKGMKKEDANNAIKRLSEALEMKDHLNKPAKKLSAGVSRKVCFAISMLGNPTIVLLDEPSTGLDPKGQQRLWRAIRAAFKNKERGAILTTHYMEEAEAVCDRVAIMVSGKLRCIGSIQHLKSKFGKGYFLEIKLRDGQGVDEIHREILRLFPQAARQDRFSSLLVYRIPVDNVQSLSEAFLNLENAKRCYNLEEYSFSQSTLEQVFLELAKEQEKEDFHVDSSFSWKLLKSEDI
ncbi:ABC-type organic anion transporter ABCA8-like [Hyperolius riggenbachi]|uniref:ABC-type organic anion transporter ABCA8-like n=1 Tax=Hyperolius riggenbachi TaxID=752182 RepID=UPI0035A2EFCC